LYYGQTVTCLDSREGTVHWTRLLSGEFATGTRHRSVAIGDSALIVTTGEAVVALELDSGRDLWVRPGALSDVHEDALVACVPGPRTIAVVPHRAEGPVLGLRAADGAEVWRYQSPEKVFALPWLAEEALLLRTLERVVAVELTTGRPRWEVAIPFTVKGGTAVAAVGGNAYVVTGRQLVEIGLADGAVIAERELAAPLARVGLSVLGTVEGFLAIACVGLEREPFEAILYLYAPERGEIAYASAPFTGDMAGSLASADARLFLCTLDDIMGFELAAGRE
jgi:outer membrane protein assembly factor BamB